MSRLSFTQAGRRVGAESGRAGFEGVQREGIGPAV